MQTTAAQYIKNKRHVTVSDTPKILAKGNTSAYLLSCLTPSGVHALSSTAIRPDTFACCGLAASNGVPLSRRPFGEGAFAEAAGCTTYSVTSSSCSSLRSVSFFSIFTTTCTFSIILYALNSILLADMCPLWPFDNLFVFFVFERTQFLICTKRKQK